MFELCVRWLAWGLDTSLKAVLVALVAAALLRLLRLRDSNIRHRIWMGVLAGMLALPVLTPFMPALRLPLMPSPEWLVAWTAEPAAPEATTQFPSTEPLPVRSPSASRSVNSDHLPPIPSFEPDSDARLASPPQSFPAREITSVSEIPINDRARPAEHLAEPLPPLPLLPPPAPRFGPSLRTAVATFVLVASSAWLLVCAFLCLRLSIGLGMAARLRHMSIGIDLIDLPSTFSAAPIRECPGIHVPLTVGAFAPQILLPTDWRRWPAEKLLAVIAHEQMHVQRADCAVALIAEINCCLYWFHPLAWWLKQQLAALAEQACDDAAIHSIGNRTQYARHLLEVAAAVSKERGRLVPAGVSMARRTSVETRIRAILDFTRPLSKRLSWTSTLLLLGMMVPLIALAAALKPLGESNRDAQPESSISATDPSHDTDEADTPSSNNEVPFIFSGTVVDDRGQPVAGANVAFGYLHQKQSIGSPLQLAVTDEQGKFQFSKKKSDLAGADGHAGWADAGLIATKDSYGIAIGAVQYFEASGQLDAELTPREREIIEYSYGKKSTVLTLVPDDVSLRGQVLDSEGRPVAEAKIEVATIWRGAAGTLDAWHSAANQPGGDLPAADQHLRPVSLSGFTHTGDYGLAAPHLLIVPPVRTAADGSFTLHGIGRDRIVELYISGPGIATMTLRARSRPGETIRLLERASNPDGRLWLYHPADFKCIAGPSVAVVGRVTDRLTGQPLAGYLVRGEKISTSEIHGGLEALHVRTITDSDGRYRLEGLPLGENILQITPPISSSHLVANIEVTTTVGAQPPVRDVALASGVRIRGRVTDSRAGKPLQGRLAYFAFLTNPHLKDAPGFDSPNYHYRSDADGRYEIPVLPGKGILAFTADNHREYRRGVGVDRIDDPKLDRKHDLLFQTQPYYRNPNDHHVLAPLDLAPDAAEVTLDFKLTSGITFTGRIRTADGQPLGEHYLYGQQTFATWNNKRTGETFQVEGYFPDEGRRLMVYQPERNLVGIKDLTGPPPSDLEIVLQPAGTFVGRVVDADGLPIENLAIGSEWGDFKVSARYSPHVAKTWGELPATLEGRNTLTDKDGRFELKGVIPGLVYSAGATAPSKMYGRMNRMYLGTIFRDATAESGQMKDFGDLQVKPRKNDEKQDLKADEVQTAAPAFGDAFTYAGSVVDPSGKPVAGAKLHLCYFTREPAPDLSPVAITDASGQFRFSRRRQDFDQRAENGAAWRAATLVATADGFGFALGLSPVFETTGRLSAELPSGWRKEMEEHLGPQTNVIKLVADAPVKGRIVNIDGQPVAGAKLAVNYIWGSRDASLDAWEKGANQPKASAFELQRSLDTLVNGPRAAAVVQVTSSDSDGWLTIKGLGKDRLAKVQLLGPGIESSFFHVRTRPGETLKISVEPQRPGSEHETFYPATFSHVAGPTQPVIGLVTDADSGQPIPGCVVQGTLHGGTANGTMVYRTGEIQTLTDADGRYRLEGLERVTKNPLRINNLLVLPPRGSNYLAAASAVSIGASSDPVTHDVSLHKGIVVRGQALDSRTGKPVLGSLRYSAFSDNSAAQAAANFARAHLDHYYYQTDANGRFEIPVLPGKGVLSFAAHNWPDYPQGVGLDKVQAASPSDGRDVAIRMFSSANLLTPIDLAAGLDETTIDLTLNSSQTILGRVLSPEGQVLKRYAVYGGPISWFWQKNESETFEVKNYDAKEGRRLLIHEPDRNLIGLHQLTGKAPAQFDIRLSPGAVIKGRIVDADGLPLENVNITNEGKPVSNPLMMQTPQPEVPGRGVLPHYLDQRRFSTDKDGRFELHGIIPGLKYTADCQGEGKIGGRTIPMGLGRLFTDIIAEPGQTKDLGDLRPNSKAPQSQSAPLADNAKKPSEAIRGRVANNENQPIVGAQIAVVGWSTQQAVKTRVRAEIIASGQTDDDGRFDLSLPNVSANSHQPSFLIARGNKTGVAWKKLDFGALPNHLSLTLLPEEPVRVRLIDIEGRPAAGAKLHVGTVTMRTNGDWPPDGIGFGREEAPPAWIAPLVADQDGRFTIHGLARDHGIWLSLEADDRFSPQQIALNTGMPEERGERDATYRALVRNSNPGEEIIVPLSPAQIFEGTIRYEDTKQPAAGARVSIWASQQRVGGSMTSVEGQTDDNGHYRIAVKPGIRFGVMAYAPQGVPYLIRQTTEDIRWENGDRVKQQDITLPPGTLIRGKVLTAGSGQPIANAAVQFIPQESAARPPMKGVVTGWQGIQNTGKDGSFQIAIPPGPGHLLVNHDTGSYVLQEIGSSELNRGKPGGERNYAHAIQKIDPAPDARSLDLTIELQPGATVSGRIVDPNGQSVDEALVISRLHIWSHWLSWHGNGGRSGPATSGRFELKGLKEGAEYPTHFLDPKRRLGATLNLKAGDKEPTIVLQPCGSATVRFVDPDGQPLADHRPNFDFIATPGAHRYDSEALRAGQLAADADFAANIDRTNHGKLKTNAAGKLTIPALIPGATYALVTANKGRWQIAKQLQVDAGQTLELGDIVVTPDNRNSAVSAAPRAPAKSTTVAVTGVVLLPDGSPAAGATVRAAAPLWASLKPVLSEDYKSPISEAKTDSTGRFSISFTTQPLGDVSKLDQQWQQFWKKTAIAASLAGYGPAWVTYEEINSNQPFTLKLVEDCPIRGRVVDLEGRPIAGTTVKIGEPQAAKDDDLSAWLAGLKAGEHSNTVWQKAPRTIEPRLIGIPTAATTDAKGMFEISGLGRDRIVGLIFEGENVAHRDAKAVTRRMETLQKIVGMPRLSANEPVFGAEFTYTAEPARTVEGIVRDAQTGLPLAGVAVESDKLSGYPISNHRVLKTTTDAQGRFRLLGMPKGNDNRLLVLPNDDQPYFMREIAVPDPVGLGPAQVEIDLHRGIWISGRVTDKATGEPVGGVQLIFYPFLSNEFAQKLPEFNANGNVDGDQSRYKTKSDGSFRIVGLPGRAVIGVVSWLRNYRSGIGYADIDAPKYDKTDWLLTYRNSIAPSPKFPNVMKEINPPADATQATIDLQLDPGQSVRISVTDPTGKPLTGFHVNGLTTFGSFDDSPESSVTAVNLGPADTRPVLFHHKEKNLGRVITIGPDETRAAVGGAVPTITAQLQPCATVRGRVLHDDGTPFSGLVIEPRVLPFGDFSKQLPSVSTDAEGRFQATLLPGCRYALAGMGGTFQYVSVADDLAIEPGETKDLGTLKVTSDGKVAPWTP